MNFQISKSTGEIMQEIAKRHCTLRKQLKLSQAEMADRSGVSLGSLKRFENTGKISLESLLKLAQILDCAEDFDLVFKEDHQMNEVEKLFSDKTRG